MALKRSVDAARRGGLQRLEAYGFLRLGMLEEESGDALAAQHCYRQGWLLARQIGERRAEAFGDIFLSCGEMRDGDVVTAKKRLDRVGLAESGGDVGIAWSARIQRCRHDLILAQRAAHAGQNRRASNLLKRAEARRVDAFKVDRSDGRQPAGNSDAARFLLGLYLRERDGEPARLCLRVAPQCTTFQLGERPPVSLANSPVSRRVLLALVEARRTRPGRDVEVDALLAAGWPGEAFRGDSGTTRVKNIVRRLRRSGLEGLLLTGEAGYRIGPTVSIERVGS